MLKVMIIARGFCVWILIVLIVVDGNEEAASLAALAANVN